jgi:hypothetical protein
MWIFEGGFELSVDVHTVRGSYFAIKQFFIRNETRPYVALPELSAPELWKRGTSVFLSVSLLSSVIPAKAGIHMAKRARIGTYYLPTETFRAFSRT